ncbi:DUSAM domain-containing protein [Myxococcus sp. RHSTA-1-4]|uniref:DUSAM domain-containing protein n=1 Tax=Myxococcus sp. RHSTA-1-4 TaxID=2874601 RepID=UPI001CC03643|nr:DUSAM domain-containing protein [Myxococcus sp. RHSTA-1-4]MBZ4419108.1 DUSAM domain-containing protein [Myxococcus sp. RHSTA-1-4]
MSDEVNWDEIRALAQQVLERGVPLELSEATRALLLRTASEVAIPREDAEDALRSVATATTLLQEMRRRIRDGSNRLTDALHELYRLRDTGRLEEARQKMHDILAVEVVPLYREIAETALENLDLRGPAPRSRKHRP